MTEETKQPSTLLTSPLEQADPMALDKLFEADPEQLTDNDIDRIVARLREARAKFAKSELESKGKKVTPLTDKGRELNLEDLGL